jgi:hypothetical protein
MKPFFSCAYVSSILHIPRVIIFPLGFPYYCLPLIDRETGKRIYVGTILATYFLREKQRIMLGYLQQANPLLNPLCSRHSAHSTLPSR